MCFVKKANKRQVVIFFESDEQHSARIIGALQNSVYSKPFSPFLRS